MDLVWPYIKALIFFVIYLSRYHDLQPVSRVPTEDGSSCTSVVHANSLNGSKMQPIAYGPATACRTKDKVGSGLEIMRERGEHQTNVVWCFSMRPLVRTAVTGITQFSLFEAHTIPHLENTYKYRNTEVFVLGV